MHANITITTTVIKTKTM